MLIYANLNKFPDFIEVVSQQTLHGGGSLHSQYELTEILLFTTGFITTLFIIHGVINGRYELNMDKYRYYNIRKMIVYLLIKRGA